MTDVVKADAANADVRIGRDDRRSIRSEILCAILWVVAVVAVLGFARCLVPVGIGAGDSVSRDARLTFSLGGDRLRLPQLCAFRGLLGYDCPGCGMTRSFVYSARLRFADAWAMHPVGTVLAVYLAVSVPHRLWRIGRLSLGRSSASTWRWEVGLVVLLAAVSYARWFWRCWDSWGMA
jgi:hypothetical protein